MIQVADLPYAPDKCNELGFIDYSKQAKEPDRRFAVDAARTLSVRRITTRGGTGWGGGMVMRRFG